MPLAVGRANCGRIEHANALRIPPGLFFFFIGGWMLKKVHSIIPMDITRMYSRKKDTTRD